MEILQTRILASASKNYNKAEVEMVVANATAEDMDYIENLCVQEAVNTLNKVCDSNPSETSNNTPAQIQTQRMHQAPRAPRVGSYPQQTPKFSGPSEKQRNVLRKAGYSDQQIGMMKASEAAKAIEDYWSRTGYSKPQAPQYPPQYDNYDNGYDD